VFDSPSAGVTAALSLRAALEEIGLKIRVGIHAGEIEEHADRNISGLAVNLAARVEAAATDGSIFVSSTMKEMLLGGDTDLENRGEHTLKGIEGSWILYEVC
jgi:class 3 adenylate cyclase